jgi:hypothetical protein
VRPHPCRAALAQPVEHRIRNAGVACSSHASGTIAPSITIGDTMDAGIYYNGRFNSDYDANSITGRIGIKF